MKATITWTCCWCQISSRRFECQSPSSPPRSWTRRSRVRLQTEQRCLIRPEGEQRFCWGYKRTCERQRGTWSAQLAVLLLLTGIHIHAPGVEGEGEEVLQARWRAHDCIQAFQPFLTLLKGGELTPRDQTQKPTLHLQHAPKCYEGAGLVLLQNQANTDACLNCIITCIIWFRCWVLNILAALVTQKQQVHIEKNCSPLMWH